MSKEKEQKDWIFGLDIGTRNVVGVLGYEESGILTIAYTTIIEHKTRAMLDGQIHDIDKVSEVIKEVKDRLEKESQLELTEVAIAAAGRVLKTKVAEAIIEFTEEKKIRKTHIQALEMQGVETAKQMLYDEIRSSLDYYCVAYSSIKYTLDGYEIENLHGHKGRQVKSTIIATFLPRQVIDSLYSAVEGAGLSVSYLTLEPISAIAVTIPREIRMLNLALVDIGAGTSDIAITKDGSITAYGMLPSAGDKFSEQLVDEYLINFDTAEKIKKNLANEEQVRFIDILGGSQCVNYNEVLDKLDKKLDMLTNNIAEKIQELNGEKSPRAVFCVGGGSQFPLLTKKLSEKLDISEDRVVIKDISNVSEEEFLCGLDITGPEYITPIGICLTAWMNRKSSFITVTLNGTPVKLLNSRTLTVMDAAIRGSYDSSNFLQKNGKDLEFTFNNEITIVHGELGTPAEITINGKTGNLMSEIKNNDIVILSPANTGKDASIMVTDLIKDTKEKKINFGGKLISVKAFIKVNELPVVENYRIQNGDFITIEKVETLEELLNYLNVRHKDFTFYINGSIAGIHVQVHDGDSIELMIKSVSEKKYEEDVKTKKDDFIVYVNDKPVTLVGKDSYIFVHVLNYIDFNADQGKGNIVLKLNGMKAAYTDPLKPEDKIEIYWENERRIVTSS